jgi:hypothetical protein
MTGQLNGKKINLGQKKEKTPSDSQITLRKKSEPDNVSL